LDTNEVISLYSKCFTRLANTAEQQRNTKHQHPTLRPIWRGSDDISVPPHPTGDKDVSDTESCRSVNYKPACAAAVRTTKLIGRWLMDAGCGYDLVSQKKVLALQSRFGRAAKALEFSTAGGITQAQTICPMTVEELGALVTPFSSNPCRPSSPWAVDAWICHTAAVCQTTPVLSFGPTAGMSSGSVLRTTYFTLSRTTPYCAKQHWSDIAKDIGITIIDNEPYFKLPTDGVDAGVKNGFFNNDLTC